MNELGFIAPWNTRSCNIPMLHGLHFLPLNSIYCNIIVQLKDWILFVASNEVLSSIPPPLFARLTIIKSSYPRIDILIIGPTQVHGRASMGLVHAGIQWHCTTKRTEVPRRGGNKPKSIVKKRPALPPRFMPRPVNWLVQTGLNKMEYLDLIRMGHL